MLIDEYVESLIARGLSDKTVRIYTRLIKRAYTALGPLDLVSASDLRRFADTFPNHSSIRRQLAVALRHYWQMQGHSGPIGAIRVPPRPRARCRALHEEDARAMVKTAMDWYPEGLAVLFGFYLALRAAEIAAAQMQRFEADLGWYRVTGKLDVTAEIPVHPALAGEIDAASIVTDWIFPGHRGRDHVHPTTILTWTRTVAKAAGVEDHVWTHRLRHTALATANDNTGDLRSVADFARHRDMNVTMIYTRTTETNLKRVAGSLDYL